MVANGGIDSRLKVMNPRDSGCGATTAGSNPTRIVLGKAEDGKTVN
jgi:hypothetical protein